MPWAWDVGIVSWSISYLHPFTFIYIHWWTTRSWYWRRMVHHQKKVHVYIIVYWCRFMSINGELWFILWKLRHPGRSLWIHPFTCQADWWCATAPGSKQAVGRPVTWISPTKGDHGDHREPWGNLHWGSPQKEGFCWKIPPNLGWLRGTPMLGNLLESWTNRIDRIRSDQIGLPGCYINQMTNQHSKTWTWRNSVACPNSTLDGDPQWQSLFTGMKESSSFEYSMYCYNWYSDVALSVGVKIG